MKPGSSSGADTVISDPHLLDRLMEEALPDRASYFKGKLRLAAGPGEEVVPCAALFEPARFADPIARLAASYAGADRRAVVSMWTLYYFSTLTIAPIVLWRLKQHVLPLDLETTSVVLSASSGLPQAFVLASAGQRATDLATSEALESMISRHLSPAIAFMTRHCGVSARLLWCNAAGYMDWIFRELSQVGGGCQGLELFGERTLANGEPNPFFGLLRRIADPGDESAEVSRRKVCCLRYALPGVGGCGAICPLREGRR